MGNDMVFSHLNRLIRIGLYFLGIFLIVSLFQSITTFWQRGNVVLEEEKRLGQLKKRHEELKSQRGQVESQQFIEKQAREKLNMSRPGEVVVVLPKITPVLTPTPTPELQPLEKWRNLFRI
ncbi:septum formation initiator family protein [Candidatus Gottesmanbacteria bacterium]|nr:septum formation initiator family protein [Candidatus Gottesmanbacteria bacterium]